MRYALPCYPWMQLEWHITGVGGEKRQTFYVRIVCVFMCVFMGSPPHAIIYFSDSAKVNTKGSRVGFQSKAYVYMYMYRCPHKERRDHVFTDVHKKEKRCAHNEGGS